MKNLKKIISKFLNAKIIYFNPQQAGLVQKTKLQNIDFKGINAIDIVVTLEKHKSIQFCFFKTENNFKVAAIKKLNKTVA